MFHVLFHSMQEVEEDKKRAEKEGMVLQSPKGKAGDLTITINKSTSVSCPVCLQRCFYIQNSCEI